MDVFSVKGNPGAGAGNAAFLLVCGLLDYLEKAGTLSPGQINAIVDGVVSRVPTMNNTILNDTRDLLQSVRR